SKEDHEVHLKLVLELLKKERLYAKFTKCKFWLQEVHFLGHVVNHNGIHVDPGKIEVVKNWKDPTTPSEIRSFFGLTGVEQEEAFQTLKNNSCDAPILSLPDGVEDFVVYCDASNQGLGEASKVENAKAKMLCGLDQLMERKEDGGMNFIWVPLIGDVRTLIMDEAHASRLTKSANFLAIREDYKVENLARLYVDEIVAGHGVPMSIISYHDGRLTSSKRTIQTLEDMLKACVMDFGGSWDNYLPLAELSYNNSYHSRIRCAPFEALYGRKYRSPIMCVEIRESMLIEPKLVQETTDKVVLIKEKLKATRDRQKSYANNRRKLLEVEVED
ncbi:putative reverse transcriptase domain-containing protein, partial [Tanacetum coccineum]